MTQAGLSVLVGEPGQPLPHIPPGSGAECSSTQRRAEGREQGREDGQREDVSEVSREPAQGKGRETQKEKRLAKNFQLSPRNLCKCFAASTRTGGKIHPLASPPRENSLAAGGVT